MIISISGTHCTGKTTLINALKAHPFFKDYIFINSPTRSAKAKGLPINNEAKEYDETQLNSLSYHLATLSSAKPEHNYILDRSLFDLLIYTGYLKAVNKLTAETFGMVRDAWEANRANYDIFVFPSHHDVKLVADGDRNEDSVFRDEIRERFFSYLANDPISPHVRDKAFIVTGDTQLRTLALINKIQSLA